MKPSEPIDQEKRLATLRGLGVLDTPREQDYDDVVALAARICETPISVINLIDENRQWFKAETGLGVRETPLDTSICAHTILQPGVTVIRDTLDDPRTKDNPLCFDDPNLRFYAGALLETDDGHALGTLCVLDTRPRDLTDLQKQALQTLARQVMVQMQYRRLAASESAARAESEHEVGDLKEAARAHEILVQEVDHRVKNSLNTVAAMLNLQSKTASSSEAAAYLSTARDRVLAIAALHEQLHIAATYDQVDMVTFLERLAESLKRALPPNVKLRSASDPIRLNTKIASAIGVIINELVTNSVKHAFPSEREGEIGFECREKDGAVTLKVWDDGVGLAHTAGSSRPSGLGVRVVQSSVEQLGGTLTQSDNEPGSHIEITFPADG